jgi:hypothetical protein
MSPVMCCHCLGWYATHHFISASDNGHNVSDRIQKQGSLHKQLSRHVFCSGETHISMSVFKHTSASNCCVCGLETSRLVLVGSEAANQPQ